MHRFWDCAISGCPRAAAIDTGGCEHSRAMFCAVHIHSRQHACDASKPLDDDTWLAAQTAELEALASKVDEEALVQRAQALSGGKPCHLDPSDPLGRRLMGGMHVHRELLFDDGTVWLVRLLRENYTSFDNEMSNAILLSECDTLRWLAADEDRRKSIPAPRLHGFGLRGDADNAVGVAYMLIDKLPGQPFDMHAATDEQTEKVLDQWAGMLCALGRHPLDKAGSLTFAESTGKDGDEIVVGAVAGDRTGTLPCKLGPFDDARGFYAAWADTHLDLIGDGQLFSGHPVDAYLMFKWIKEQTQKMSFGNAEWASLHKGPFFLRHVDDKGDHLLVDDDYNITGVIDWTFARTAPAYEAFAPALVTSDTSSLFSGTPGLSKADRVLGQTLHHHQAPYCFFDADPMRRLLFGVGVGVSLSLDEMPPLFVLFLGDRHLPASRPARYPPAVTVPASAVAAAPSAGNTLCYAPPATTSYLQPTRGESWSLEKQISLLLGEMSLHVNLVRKQLDDAAWEQTITDEIDALLAQVDIPALERRAAALRHGMACTFRRGKHIGDESTMGCANYHAWLVFADGERWLARLPRTTDGSDVPTDLVNYLVASEYATLRWLEQNIPGVRAPRAYAYGLAGDASNDVGAAYLLEEALPGRPFQAYEATPDQRRRVYDQYADVLAEVSRHPVARACSLIPVVGGDTVEEGPLASERFVRLGQHGPYTDALSFYASVAELHLDLIADGQIFYDYPREAYLFYRLLRDQAAPVLSSSTNKNKDTLAGFFLKHADDKGDHILVDDNCNVTGIIDWQFARFVPAIEAFGPSLVTADMGSLYDGKLGLSDDDKLMATLLRGKGHLDLARLAEEQGSDLARRFHSGLASGLSRDEASGMLAAVLTLLRADYGGSISQWTAKEWLTAQEDNDPRWQQIEDNLKSCANVS